MVLSRTISYKQKPSVRDVADRDMFILKPDECILKPDKTLWRQKLNSFPHTELQLRAWSPFHMTGNKFELHAYVCVLTDKVFAILCWGSSQRWWVLTRGLNTWFRLINRTHIQDAAALLASVTCTLTSGGRGSDALVCALFACVLCTVNVLLLWWCIEMVVEM